MKMTNFYEKTGGVTLLVIKHRGESFDYVNGSKGNAYFGEKWESIIPLMQKDKFYVIACTEQENRNGKATLIPFGVAFQCENEQHAKKISYEHVSDINTGRWVPEYQLEQLIKDCNTFQVQVFIKARMLREQKFKDAKDFIKVRKCKIKEPKQI